MACPFVIAPASGKWRPAHAGHMAVGGMTARHEGMDRPHHHVVNRAALNAAVADTLTHIAACAVCALAEVTAQQRGRELGALGWVDDLPVAVRDQYYRETATRYCVEGQALTVEFRQFGVWLLTNERRYRRNPAIYAWLNREDSEVFHRVRDNDGSLTICKLPIGPRWVKSTRMPQGRFHCGGACFYGSTVRELTHNSVNGTF